MRMIFATLIVFAALTGCGGDSTQSAPAQSGTDAASPATQGAPSAAPVKKRSTELATGAPTPLYFIDWGGDAATLLANGGPSTTKGSVMDGLGLNFKLEDGNDVAVQVKAYRAGKTPYLRLTTQQAADVAPELCATPDLCPAPVAQLTWSTGGDHLVAVERLKTIADLTGGVRIAAQGYGPHEGLLVEVVETDAKLSLGKVQIVRAKNLTGDDSPVSLLQTGKADAAFVITPDRDLLTSGGSVGTGAEGSVKGAHEILSTAERTRSIADLYYVNPQYFASNKGEVVKFAVGVLMGQEEIVELQKAYNAGGSEDYRTLLAELGDLMGSLPDGSEADAAGLIADCSFVGHPGNVAFFTDDDAKSLVNWAYFNRRGAEVAVQLGYSKSPVTLPEGIIDWNLPIFKQNLAKTEVAKNVARFDAAAVRHDIEKMEEEGSFADNTRLSFTAYFPENETRVDGSKYEAEFARMLELGQTYTRAAIVIRGHADPTHMVANIIRAGIKAGVVQESGNASTGRTFFMEGRPLNLKSDRKIIKLATSPQFNGAYAEGDNPRELASAAIEMTKQRADAVRDAYFLFAKKHSVTLDESQVQTDGVGFAEPLVVKASTPDEAGLNRRVEFALVRVSAEAVTQSDFDL